MTRALRMYCPLLQHSLLVIAGLLGSLLAQNDAIAGGCFGKLSNQAPCSVPSSTSRLNANVRRTDQSRNLLRLQAAPALLSSQPVNVKVVNTVLKNLPGQRGEWSGMITGFGRTTLYLQIVRGAKLEDEFRIGDIEVNGQPIPFHYRAQLPRSMVGSGAVPWDWRVATK